jgi:tetraprenyl-beta-curcumene synthase
MVAAARDGMATLSALAAHRASALPAVQRELAGWRRVADGIPDPALRRDALSALTDKAANPEATAVLATLAPRRTRPTVIRASTALQVAIDYLDSLGERPEPDPLKDGLQLHRSLGIALTPGGEPDDWYRHHLHHDDGGYLDRLVRACQESVATLPSEAVLPFARRAAERCGEGQSRTHAALGNANELEAWARAQSADSGFSWWEVAAGASSSVAAHALIALAAQENSSEVEAQAVDDAYFPAIGALTVLLDDLLDRKEDEAAGEHNYLGYYPDTATMAKRLTAIATAARAGTVGLRQASRHAAILSGVVAYYLSSPGIDPVLPSPARRRLLAAAGPATGPLAALLRRRGER